MMPYVPLPPGSYQQKPNPRIPPSQEIISECGRLLKNGELVAATALYKSTTGAGLSESLAAVKQLAKDSGFDGPWK